MKLKFLVLGLLFLGFAGACTQKTCPTYAKEDIKVEQSDKANS